MRTRTNFAVPQLLSAAELARHVAHIEDENIESEFGAFWDTLFGSSQACVILATASLESYANELFVDRQDNFPDFDPPTLELVWKEFERGRLIQKFELAARLRKKEPLEFGREPTQSILILVSLRNAIVHFRPEWFDSPDSHHKISKLLKSKITLSRWLSNEPAFPRAWASAAATAWAVQSVINFAKEFSERSGLPNKFEPFIDRLSTTPQHR